MTFSPFEMLGILSRHMWTVDERKAMHMWTWYGGSVIIPTLDANFEVREYIDDLDVTDMSDIDVVRSARWKISRALDTMWFRAPSLGEDITVYRFTKKPEEYDHAPTFSFKSFTLAFEPIHFEQFLDSNKRCCLMSLTIPAGTPILVDALYGNLSEVIFPRGTIFHHEHEEEYQGFAMRVYSAEFPDALLLKKVESLRRRPHVYYHDFNLATDQQHFKWSQGDPDAISRYNDRIGVQEKKWNGTRVFFFLGRGGGLLC
ncbi:hypothetical protein SARC_07278 [Sphaeroforma arctica JP610]|uniref:Uncharacterized protein n=1 Tax=Sphaeroforma arctica JP610 TaxID=667725 RepID=A0A0L0FU34_9EUKA|nr:hypothetical protein SARC_07278 [Sphaeroforma arctica JP610]KNC80360.1 hypothetical protein SARC_07278 [Sphaeroforma arctica JP610]|eukprot:XP_014154262.1 hypothetical protein SARC_07278 [Sphaeroforma arctica JP610]